MQPIKVVVLETNEEQDADYAMLFGPFLRALGYRVNLRTSFVIKRDVDDVLDYLKDESDDPCYLFICDLSLVGKAERHTHTGDIAVSIVKEVFPEVFCILTSWDGPASTVDNSWPRTTRHVYK